MHRHALVPVVFSMLLFAASCADPRPVLIMDDGSSVRLDRTAVVPTLDTPLNAGQNAIWCASFVAAWKELADQAGGDVLLRDAQETAELLNRARDPRGDVPEGALYSTAGWVNQGIRERIFRDLAAQFPDKAMPTLPEDDGILAYAYLRAHAPFTYAFQENDRPLVFTDSLGTQTEVRSFGTKERRDSRQLRQQCRVLFADDTYEDDAEFALDLCVHSSPSQVVVARIEPQPTLAMALAHIDEQARKYDQQIGADSHHRQIGEMATLLVPEMLWMMCREFVEMEGSDIDNPGFEGFFISMAQQDISFRLDRFGASVESEALIQVAASLPPNRIFNRPFLVYMKKRGAADPYFVMRVDNAELLTPWDGPKR